jgi:SAM-dependent methyltransferase
VSSPNIPVVQWGPDSDFTIENVNFTMTVDLSVMHQLETSDHQFIICKNRGLVDEAIELHEANNFKRIVEIGIFKGGSIALYALLFRPELLIAIEFMPEPIPALDSFVKNKKLEDVVKLHYGVDQEDRATLLGLVEPDLGGQALDLVIDDGSHNYQKTKSSFETLFPLLRPGGMFIVEDWGWAHWPGDVWQKSEAFPAENPSLTNLLLEICMLSASCPGIVSQVVVETSLFRVIRGHEPLVPGFALGDHYLNRGKPFAPVM